MFRDSVRHQFNSGQWELIQKFDDGTLGTNEIGHVKFFDGKEIVHKVMLAIEQYYHVPPKGWDALEIKPTLGKVSGRQKRKALSEAVFSLLDKGIGGTIITPEIYVQIWEPFDSYYPHWGKENIEGHKRVCEVVREYVPDLMGPDWRGELYSKLESLPGADAEIKQVMTGSLDAQRMSVLDMLTINQDRSATNWATDGNRFYAVDNGMAWFGEYPEGDWRNGCAIDDVILQVDEWKFIAGAFSTLWEGRELSPELYDGMKNFDKNWFLNEVGKIAVALGLPEELKKDWRFYAILKRLDWMVEHRRLPSAAEYRSWLEGSEFMTPPEAIASGGKIVWEPGWDTE